MMTKSETDESDDSVDEEGEDETDFDLDDEI